MSAALSRLLALICALGILIGGTSAFAVEPDEMLEDPALEARAREISKDLRCVVCQNESIDESNAAMARDLRLLVRERLVAGDSDAQVQAYVVERFGEFVLLKPLVNSSTLLLWLSGPILFLIAGGIVFAVLRSRGAAAQGSAALSQDEQKALEEILNQEDSRT